MKEKFHVTSKNSTKKLKDQELPDLEECLPPLDDTTNFTTVTDQPKSQQVQTLPQQQQLHQTPQQCSPPLQRRKEAIQNTPDDYLNVSSNNEIIDTSRSSGVQMPKQIDQDAISQSRCNLEFKAVGSSVFDSSSCSLLLLCS